MGKTSVSIFAIFAATMAPLMLATPAQGQDAPTAGQDAKVMTNQD